MGTNQVTQIEYCQPHYDELIGALLERNLHDHLATDSAELADRLEKGKMDAGLEVTSAITSIALQMFGPDHVLASDGCPLCAIHNIVTHVADHIAVKYTRSN
jgi:hypothetical protein